MEVSDNWDDFINKFNKSIQSQADMKKLSLSASSTQPEEAKTPDEDKDEYQLCLFSESDFLGE